VKIELDSLLEGLEAKLWLLVIAEMEVLLAEEILAALDELTTLAESSRHGSGATATHRAKRLEATVARIDAELEAIERLLTVNAGKSLRPTKATSESGRNGQATTTAARRNRGRPRKPETDATTNGAETKIDTINTREAIS
jgi:acyl-CoA reductase-like NAD-dependent aldehyde dehydrogenase